MPHSRMCRTAMLLAASLAALALARGSAAADPTVPPGFHLQLWSGKLPSGSGSVAVAPASFGTHGGEAFVTRYTEGELWRVNAAGDTSLFALPRLLPNAVVFGPGGPWSEDLYVNSNVSVSDSQRGMIWRIGPNGIATEMGSPTPSSHLFGGGGLAMSTGGAFGVNLYAGVSAGFPGDCVSLVSPAFGAPVVFCNFPSMSSIGYFGNPSGLAFGPGLGGWTTDLYLGLFDSDPLTNVISPGGIYRVDAAGTASPVLTRTTDSRVQRATSIAFGPGNAFGRSLYVATPTQVLRVESNGTASVFMDGFATGASAGVTLTFAPTGELVVVDSGAGQLWRVLPGALSVAPPAPGRLRLVAARQPSRGEAGLVLELPAAASVRVEIFDAAGRRVATPFEGALDAGEHALSWNGADAHGASAPDGVYFAVATVDPRRVGTRLVRLAR